MCLGEASGHLQDAVDELWSANCHGCPRGVRWMGDAMADGDDVPVPDPDDVDVEAHPLHPEREEIRSVVHEEHAASPGERVAVSQPEARHLVNIALRTTKLVKAGGWESLTADQKEFLNRSRTEHLMSPSRCDAPIE